MEEKLPNSPLANYFPDYSGKPADVQAAIEFFGDKFMELKPNPSERTIYSHATCATDTENIKVVDVAVQEVILKNLFEGIMLT